MTNNKTLFVGPMLFPLTKMNNIVHVFQTSEFHDIFNWLYENIEYIFI